MYAHKISGYFDLCLLPPLKSHRPTRSVLFTLFTGGMSHPHTHMRVYLHKVMSGRLERFKMSQLISPELKGQKSNEHINTILLVNTLNIQQQTPVMHGDLQDCVKCTFI